MKKGGVWCYLEYNDIFRTYFKKFVWKSQEKSWNYPHSLFIKWDSIRRLRFLIEDESIFTINCMFISYVPEFALLRLHNRISDLGHSTQNWNVLITGFIEIYVIACHMRLCIHPQLLRKLWHCYGLDDLWLYSKI